MLLNRFVDFFMPGYDQKPLLVSKKTRSLLYSNFFIGILFIFLAPVSLLTEDRGVALALTVSSILIFLSCFFIRAGHYLLANYFTSVLCITLISLDLFISVGEEISSALIYRGAFTFSVFLLGNTFFSFRKTQPLFFSLLSFLILATILHCRVLPIAPLMKTLSFAILLNCFFLLLAAGIFGFLMIQSSYDLIQSSEEKSRQLESYVVNLQKIVDEKTADLLKNNLLLLKEIEERKKEEKRFRDLANLLPETVYETDEKGRVTFMNRQGLKTFGITETHLEKGLNAFEAFGGEEKTRALKKRLETLKAGGVSREEYRVKRADGKEFPVCIYTAPIIENGRIAGTRGFIIDITEQKRIEENLQKSNENLKQFAYAASHDLKEPLRTVAGFIELSERKMKKAPYTDPEILGFMGFALEGTKRMNQLINDLLEYSRIQNETLCLEEFNLKEPVQLALMNLKALIEEKKARIDLPEKFPLVQGRKSHLIILFQNLIQNALKYQPENQIPEITLKIDEDSDFYQIQIQDNGIGIAPDQLEKIFQIFHRLHSRRKYAGSGIGLALCRKIIEKYGGQIWAQQNAAGPGSVFTFTLPKP